MADLAVDPPGDSHLRQRLGAPRRLPAIVAMSAGLRRVSLIPEREGRRPFTRYALSVAVVALVYFGAAMAGNALKFTGNVDAIWPPAGVGIAALYLFGMELWPGVLIGDILADSPHTLPLISSVGQTAGNMAEAMVAAYLLRRQLGWRSPLVRLDALVRFAGIVLLGTAISATVGSLSLRAGGVISLSMLPDVWRTWWVGDTCGALLIVPLAIAWLRPEPDDEPLGGTLELLACAAALLLLAGVAFDSPHHLVYLVFPAVVWATARFGARGGTLAVAAASGIAIWETADSNGPFVLHSITDETLAIQLYIAAMIATSLALTAMLSERRAFARTLDESRTRLIESAEIERTQLERNLHDGAQQRLSALAIRLRAAGSYGEDQQTVLFMRHAGEELERAIDELRELARGIHPSLLSRFGLPTALEGIANRSTVDVSLELALPGSRLEAKAETTAYYVVAEALANVQRHADATHARIRVSADDDALIVTVADDGVGGAVERPDSGLRGLRDRVEGVGGAFSLVSPPGSGTVMTARIPLGEPVLSD
ncbi:MAG TPA: MASE1 domain-containing protein [Gaiellaceae bacterium]|nr:MASE1 domain-containing protein [Gaiellaceae bacterium]